MYRMSDDEFESAVQDALDSMPDAFLDALDNVVILIDDEPENPEMLGLYEGLPLIERDDGYGFGEFPDTITIFKGPHERLEGGREEVLEEVRRTVVHEVGHYFGMSEEQVDKMGYA